MFVFICNAAASKANFKDLLNSDDEKEEQDQSEEELEFRDVDNGVDHFAPQKE